MMAKVMAKLYYVCQNLRGCIGVAKGVQHGKKIKRLHGAAVQTYFGFYAAVL